MGSFWRMAYIQIYSIFIPPDERKMANPSQINCYFRGKYSDEFHFFHKMRIRLELNMLRARIGITCIFPEIRVQCLSGDKNPHPVPGITTLRNKLA